MRSRFLFRRLIPPFLILFLLVPINKSNADSSTIGDSGKIWLIPDSGGGLGDEVYISDNTVFGYQSSQLVRDSFFAGVSTSEDPTCATASDPKCTGVSYQFTATLKQCQDVSATNCITDFGTVDTNGKKTSAIFQRYFPLKAQNEFVGDAKLNIPSGGGGSVYQVPSAPFPGGDQYYLEVTVRGHGNGQSQPTQLNEFSANLYPVAQKFVPEINSGWPNAGISRHDPTSPDGISGNGYIEQSISGMPGTSCTILSTTDQTCLERYAFPTNSRFFLTVKLKQEPAGWMHGRISNPNISINHDLDSVLINIQADPLAVPVVYKDYKWDQMPSDLSSHYNPLTGGYTLESPIGKDCQSGTAPGGHTACNPDPTKRNVILAPSAYTQSAFEQLLLWLPYVSNRAQAMYGDWSVRTLSENESSGANTCFTQGQGMTGIVTTNSSTYSPGPPFLNKATGSLDYKVAAPHYTSTGEVFSGKYDLLMRSDVARCIYGFTKAPISATISVTSSDGSNTVASTTFSENNGWVHLAANGFTFSSPTISVKLDQAKEVVAPSPSPTQVASPVATASAIPAPKPTVLKKTTITCIKGKLTKTVTAVKPVCPAGYKKK